MVITKLYGGLGNQMYQFAAGKALSERLRARLYLNLEWFEEVKKDSALTQRSYELDGFGIKPKKISSKDRLSAGIKPLRLLKESSFSYNREFEKISGNIMLDGYWQSYKYFDSYRPQILGSFKFPRNISRVNQSLIGEIEKSDSVSLHVRRGDYTTKRGRDFHGVLNLKYYEAAISIIAKDIRPYFYVFSDEIEWCKKNIKLNYPMTFIDSNDPYSGVEDMRLMSACKHNIIANSSFSWWGAWLNKNPGKIICAPANWLSGRESNIEDRLPKDWIKI